MVVEDFHWTLTIWLKAVKGSFTCHFSRTMSHCKVSRNFFRCVTGISSCSWWKEPFHAHKNLLTSWPFVHWRGYTPAFAWMSCPSFRWESSPLLLSSWWETASNGQRLVVVEFAVSITWHFLCIDWQTFLSNYGLFSPCYVGEDTEIIMWFTKLLGR